MRAALIVNPEATSTTAAGREVLAHALASELKLDVLETRYRGHAAETARQAVIDGVDLVIAHGGDGTVNEVINGMLSADDARQGWTPDLAVVPGGSANVFARALGLPRDPMEATHRLLNALEADRRRWIGLGKANDRWFAFNAGLGWDADVVAEVDRLRGNGKRVTPALYTRLALACYFRTCVRRTQISVQPDEDPAVSGLHTAFVSNTNPWTYLGSRPVRANPDTSFDTGLGIFALRSLNTYSVLRHVAQMLQSKPRTKHGSSSSSRPTPHGNSVYARADLGRLHVTCQEPLRLQVDGDNLGKHTAVDFVSVPDALRVVV